MRNKWNTFCKKVKKSKADIELKFERSVVKGFLQALGWSEYDDNLEEQKGAYGGKDRPDFYLHTQHNEEDRLIVIELKRPEHKQKAKDIEQLERYLKNFGCKFGIYLGEKLEVFYRQPKGDDFVAVSVTTIDYTPDTPAAEQLLQLIKFDSFDKAKLDKYCREHLEVDEFVKKHLTKEGQQELYDAIIEKCNLSPAVISKLKSVLTFNISRNQPAEVEEQLISSVSPEIPKKEGKNYPKNKGEQTNSVSSKLIEEFLSFSLQSVSESTAKRYVSNLNNKVRNFINKLVSPDADSVYSFSNADEIRNCIKQLSLNTSFVEADEKSSGYLLAALNKYLEFIDRRDNKGAVSDVAYNKLPTTEKEESNTWLICYDAKQFKVEECLRERGQIYWRHKSNTSKLRKGDTAFLYANSPHSAVRFKVKVVEDHLPYSPDMDVEDSYAHPGSLNSDHKDKLYFIVRQIGETHSLSLTHKVMLENRVIGMRPTDTMLSKEEFLPRKEYIEQHFLDGALTIETHKHVKNKRTSKYPKKNGRRPPFKFHMIGLKPGDIITFNPTGANVKVHSDDTIEYQGKIWQLSPFCQKYHPQEGSENQQFQGASYFKYQGKTLARIRNEKEGYVRIKKSKK